MVSGMVEPTTRNMQEGPSCSITSNAIEDITFVSSNLPIYHCVDLYAVGNDDHSVTIGLVLA